MRASQGLTLLEAVLVFALMMGLMLLITAFFIKGQRYATASETYGSTQRQATILLGRMVDELHKASRLHMMVGSSNDEIAAISFADPEGASAGQPEVQFDTSTGRLVWKKWVAFYHDEPTRQVRRVETPLPSTTTDLAAAPTPLPDFPTLRSNPQAKPIGQDVRDFEVGLTATGASLTVTVAKQVPLSMLKEAEKDVSVTVRMDVHMLN